MLAPPPTSYARSDDARLAFQVMGEGPPDVVFVGGPASHLDIQWEDPETVRARQRYASFARIITFDRRGTGLSDPVDRPPTLDQQMDDLDAVLVAQTPGELAGSVLRVGRETPMCFAQRSCAARRASSASLGVSAAKEPYLISAPVR